MLNYLLHFLFFAIEFLSIIIESNEKAIYFIRKKVNIMWVNDKRHATSHNGAYEKTIPVSWLRWLFCNVILHIDMIWVIIFEQMCACPIL